jgi:hypothetical protein
MFRLRRLRITYIIYLWEYWVNDTLTKPLLITLLPNPFYLHISEYFSHGVRLSPLGTAATTDLLYQPQMIDGDCEGIGGMRICRGNRSTRRKPAPVPLCSPQMPHDLTRARTWATAVGSRPELWHGHLRALTNHAFRKCRMTVIYEE